MITKQLQLQHSNTYLYLLDNKDNKDYNYLRESRLYLRVGILKLIISWLKIRRFPTNKK